MCFHTVLSTTPVNSGAHTRGSGLGRAAGPRIPAPGRALTAATPGGLGLAAGPEPPRRPRAPTDARHGHEWLRLRDGSRSRRFPGATPQAAPGPPAAAGPGDSTGGAGRERNSLRGRRRGELPHCEPPPRPAPPAGPPRACSEAPPSPLRAAPGPGSGGSGRGPRSAGEFNGRAGPGAALGAAQVREAAPRASGWGRACGGGRARPFYVPLGRGGRGGGLRGRPGEGGGSGAPSLPPSCVSQGLLGRSSAPRRPRWQGTKASSAGRAEGGGSPAADLTLGGDRRRGEARSGRRGQHWQAAGGSPGRPEGAGARREEQKAWLAASGLKGKRVRFGVIITAAAHARPGVFLRPYASGSRAKPAPAASLGLITGGVGTLALSALMPWSGMGSNEILVI